MCAAGAHKPSSEKGVHLAAYQTFPEVGYVIHTHQTYATAIGLCGFEQLAMTEEEAEKLGGIARAAYGLSSTEKLAGGGLRCHAVGGKGGLYGAPRCADLWKGQGRDVFPAPCS